MFIELADHLRCPADHEERFMVLLPDQTEDRSVRAGQLGCPVCNRTFRIVDGVFDAGGAPHEPPPPSALDGEAITALTGLSGPGGYLVLVGGAAGHAAAVSVALPRVGIVAVNPGSAASDGGAVSVLYGSRLPLKASSMRGVVLGPGYAESAFWVGEALRVTLSGLRIVGEGALPEHADLEVLASAGGCWVGSKTRNRL